MNIDFKFSVSSWLFHWVPPILKVMVSGLSYAGSYGKLPPCKAFRHISGENPDLRRGSIKNSSPPIRLAISNERMLFWIIMDIFFRTVSPVRPENCRLLLEIVNIDQ
jgi:hypothetical protein